MSLMPCPENCGQPRVSTTAASCPSCGCDIQAFLRTKLSERVVGFPLDPIRYWYEWHFWYYAGCRPLFEPVVASAGWIGSGEPLVTMEGISIRSPFSGLVVRDRIRLNRSVEIGHSAPCNEVVVIRPARDQVRAPQGGEDFEAVGILGVFAFEELVAAIERAVFGHSVVDGIGKAVAKSLGLRSRFDPKGRFATPEEAYRAATKLYDVTPVWLPNWDFESGAYHYG